MPRKVYVDANVFLRHLLQDIPDQAAEAEALFTDAVAGKVSLHTSDLVIAELVWTLESFYKRTKREIADFLEALVTTNNFHFDNRPVLERAIRDYASLNVDFIDAHSAAYALDKGISHVKTFDKKHYRRFTDLEII